jgi:hypothetical protein
MVMLNFLLILWILVVIFTGPIALIWSLNTLFGLGIVVGLKTWAAALFILSLFAGNFK